METPLLFQRVKESCGTNNYCYFGADFEVQFGHATSGDTPSRACICDSQRRNILSSSLAHFLSYVVERYSISKTRAAKQAKVDLGQGPHPIGTTIRSHTSKKKKKKENKN